MLGSLRSFFRQQVTSISGGRQAAGFDKALQLAAAALLVEVSRADHHIDKDEERAIAAALQSLFNLSIQEVDELFRMAKAELDDATCLYEFTRLINDHFEYGDRVALIEQLWRIAFADAEKHHHEEHLIRKLADLIYVSHKDFIVARERVQNSKCS